MNKKIKDLQLFHFRTADSQQDRPRPVKSFVPFEESDIDLSVEQRFEKQVSRYRDKAAVVEDSHVLTYDFLNGLANRVGRSIEARRDDRFRLSDPENSRYRRQMMLAGWGAESQEKLKRTTVFVAGAGGSGSPVIMQLALLGIGTIIVCDFDNVELSNLNRQVLHNVSRIGMNKAVSAQKAIRSINPHVKVIPRTEAITAANVADLVGESAVIFDNVDQMQAKFVLSRYAVEQGIPHIISSMIDISSYAAVFHTPFTPCFHCLYDRNVLKDIAAARKKYRKFENPVAAPSLFASTGFAVNEALKILLGFENPAYNRYFLFNQRGSADIVDYTGFREITFPFSRHFRKLSREQDFDWEKGFSGKFVEELHIAPDPACPVCGENSRKRDMKAAGISRKEQARVPDIDAPVNPLATQRGETVGLLLGQNSAMVTAIMGVLKTGRAYVPLDPTYPEMRLADILDDSQAGLIVCDDDHHAQAMRVKERIDSDIPVLNIDRIDRTVSAGNLELRSPSGQIAYILYTSGSTGSPKGVVQTHQYILHLTYSFTNSLHIGSTDRLTLLPTFSFSAAMMDLFGALLNGASLYLWNVRKNGIVGLAEWMIRHKISIYHSVPTLFRYFASNLRGEQEFKDLRLIYLAGELMLMRDVELYRRHFTRNCLMINGLGCTEFNICRQFFMDHRTVVNGGVVPVGYAAAGADVLVLDEAGKPVLPNQVGEIAVKSRYLAVGYWNQPDLTQNRFRPASGGEDERVYLTGDRGRLSPEGCLTHLGRLDTQVKIRGQRVETAEIESMIDRVEGIIKSVVVAREDGSGEKELAAYYAAAGEATVDETSIIEYLKKYLPPYMFPASFTPLTEFPLTFSGKIDRQALALLPVSPAPPRAGVEKPVDAVESVLAEIWSGVLGVDRESIGRDSNLFDLGGNSLKAIMLTARVHQQFDSRLQLADIFARPTLKGLADYLKVGAKERHLSIDPVEKREFYNLSPAQKRMFISQQIDPASTNYNMLRVVDFPEEMNLERFKTTFDKLIARHESLRSSFHLLGRMEEPVQRVHSGVSFGIDHLEAGDGDLREIIEDFDRPFDLAYPPQLRVCLIQADRRKYTLLVDMHHIISDGVSHDLLVKDFLMLYRGEDLPHLRLHYKDYAVWWTRRIREPKWQRVETYWLEQFRGNIPVLSLPTDYPRPEIPDFSGSVVDFALDKEETARLREAALETGATLYMVLLSICNIWLSRLSGQEDIVVGTPVAGRRHVDLEGVIGMFVNTLALRNYPAPAKTFRGFLEEVRERTLTAFDNQDYPFEDLVKNVAVNRDVGRHPLFDVMFQLQNQAEAADEWTGDDFSGNNLSRSLFDISLLAAETGGSLTMRLVYRTALFKEDSIKSYIGYLKEIVSTVLSNEDMKIENIKGGRFLTDKKLRIPAESGDFAF